MTSILCIYKNRSGKWTFFRPSKIAVRLVNCSAPQIDYINHRHVFQIELQTAHVSKWNNYVEKVRVSFSIQYTCYEIGLHFEAAMRRARCIKRSQNSIYRGYFASIYSTENATDT